MAPRTYGTMFKNMAKMIGGGAVAWTAGSGLGDMAFGKETPDLKNQPLMSRGMRFEAEQAIKPWTYDRPEHIVQLSKSEWRRYPLEVKKPDGKTGMILRFQLPSVHGRMGVDVASCVLLRYKDATTGEYVVRPYTPISMDWDFGHIDLCVKRYPDGKMGNHLHNMAVGESVEIKGPFPNIVIEPNTYSTIGLIGGGSGITPLWQVMMYLAKHPHNRTNCSLVYANNKYDDIMLESSLRSLVQAHHRMKMYNTIVEGDPLWKEGLGYVNKSMIAAKMPPPGCGKVLVCGPPAMMEAVCGKKGPKNTQGELGGMLKEMGYSEEDVHKF